MLLRSETLISKMKLERENEGRERKRKRGFGLVCDSDDVEFKGKCV